MQNFLLGILCLSGLSFVTAWKVYIVGKNVRHFTMHY